jgi:hypothetical protein
MTNLEQNEISPPQPPRKPTSGVVALGVISIIYSSLFMVCCPGFGLLTSPFIFKAIERMCQRLGITGYQTTEAMRAFGMIGGSVSVVLGAMLLAGGIGLLRLKQWARVLSIWTAAAVMAWAVINQIIVYLIFYPQFFRMMEEQKDMTANLIGSIIGSSIGLLFRLAYPLVLIICLNLISIKSQFQASDSHSH